MVDIAKALGLNIRKYRKARHLSQEQLSEMIGIQPRQMSKLETGIHFPSLKTLESLCAILDVIPRDLFDFDYAAEDIMDLLDGTYNISNYRVLKTDNVYQLLNKEDKSCDIVRNSSEKYIEQNFIDMARKTKETITVEYFENNKYANTVVYYPDGTYNLFSPSSNENISKLLKEIIKISNDSAKVEYLTLALSAFDNPEAITELELILKGLKLAHR